MPRVGPVLRVFDELAEEGWCQTVDIAARLSNDVTRHKLGRILKHVNEAVQFAQNIVGDVLRGTCFTVQINRNIGITES